MKINVEIILLYVDIISLFVSRKYQRIRKDDGNSKHWRRKSQYLLNDLRNFQKTIKKDVTYDNIKSHKKSRLRLLSRKYIFGKTSGGVKLYPAHPF